MKPKKEPLLNSCPLSQGHPVLVIEGALSFRIFGDMDHRTIPNGGAR